MRVAAGAIARKYLREKLGIEIRGYLSQLGPIELARSDLSIVDENPFFCADPDESRNSRISWMRCARGRLDRRENQRAGQQHTAGPWRAGVRQARGAIAHGLMSINAVKGVELGAGFEPLTQRGSEHRDEIGAGRVRQERCRRHARRNLVRAGLAREHRAQTDVEYFRARQDD